MKSLFIKYDALSLMIVINFYDVGKYEIFNSIFANLKSEYNVKNSQQVLTIEVYKNSITAKSRNINKRIQINNTEHLIYVLIDLISEPYNVILNKEFAFFHGSVVSKDNKCVLIIAPTMQGKTTLCAKLSLMGYTYVSDDLIIVDENMNLYPLPTPVKIRRNTVLNKECFKLVYNIFETKDYYILTAKKRLDLSKLYSPCKVLFLNRNHSESEMHISQISPIDATNKFIINSAYFSNVYTHITASKKLAERCICYDINYNHFQEIIDRLSL